MGRCSPAPDNRGPACSCPGRSNWQSGSGTPPGSPPRSRRQPARLRRHRQTHLPPKPGHTNQPPPRFRPTSLGPLRITAHGTDIVNWGSNTTPTGPYTTTGGPYPTGIITHTYDTVGTLTITVREDWTATWTIGSAGGTLTNLHTTGTLPDFAVRQIEAVITG